LYKKNNKNTDGRIELVYNMPVAPVIELDKKAERYCRIE
tara:strand:+ start:208 stop:324 length:117 start_codon:yes stop_codon:yes gene_type:complete